jgi:LacI family fructose operon transcriptional repressor
MNRRKVTIYDIAELSGASPSTVSAVLNGTWSRRRISAATADEVTRIAVAQGYSANLQARGLRQARSGLVGMIIPLHDNRFFSSLSQNFDQLARERGLCPVIASTLRDPLEERRVVETLISYAVDAIFIAGASDPGQLGDICRKARLKHIFIDLLGENAPSIVTDNYAGAQHLANHIMDTMAKSGGGTAATPYFLGGAINDHATARRLEAFRNAVQARGGQLTEAQTLLCGYAPLSASAAIAQLCDRLGALPNGLFVNSITAFEGVMNHFVTLPPEAFANCAIGCFDYDPFAAFLQFPVFMVRQDSHGLMAKAYDLLDRQDMRNHMHVVLPELIEPRTIAAENLANIG